MNAAQPAPQGRGRRNTAIRLVSALLLAQAPALIAAPEPAPAPDFEFVREASEEADGRRAQIAALILNGDEQAGGVGYRDAGEGNDADVALEMLLESARLHWSRQDDGWRIATPLGETRIARSDTTVEAGVTYIALTTLSQRLAASVQYDAGEAAVRMDVPWDVAAPVVDATDAATVVHADVEAPNANMSFLRGNVSTTRRSGSHASSLNAVAGGLLGSGFWNAELAVSEFDGDRVTEMPALWWLREHGRSRSLLGVDRVYLHPLLESAEFAGAQYAWTNAPDTVYGNAISSAGSGSGQLVPYAASPTSVIRGDGPAGGIAELRIGGVAIARELIGFDGQYEFRNVPARPGDALRVQVAIYAFGQPQAPIRIDERYSQAGNLQLPAGATVHFGGVGSASNPLREADAGVDGTLAFYQYRHAINSRVTMDAIVQTLDARGSAALGAAVNLGSYGVWSGYAATTDESRSGWQVLGDGQRGEWFWRADLLDRDAGMWEEGDTGVRSERAEFGREFDHRHWRFSIVRGYYDDGRNEPIDFVKPGAIWRPANNLEFALVPDFDGSYLGRAYWGINPRTSLTATRFNRSLQLELQRGLGENLNGRATVLRDEDGDQSYGAFLGGYVPRWRRLSWTAGGFVGEDPGLFASANLELFPGLSLQVMAQDAEAFGGDGEGKQITVSITGDLALTDRGFAPGFSAAADARRYGGVAGSVALPEGFEIDSELLAGLPVLVDGRVRTRTVAGGRFSIDSLQPGIYTVALDSEGLPIELSVREPARAVEVRAGGITALAFSARLVIGFAGRIASELPAGAHLVVQDPEGQQHADVAPNRFGYYRIDGLSPGRYRVLLLDAAGATLQQRDIELVDRFLFGQDLP